MPRMILAVLGFSSGVLLSDIFPIFIVLPFMVAVFFTPTSFRPVVVGMVAGILRPHFVGPESQIFGWMASIPLFEILRTYLQNFYIQLLGEQTGGLVTSLVFGAQAANLSYELKDAFRIAGVIHLLVASGAQVGILAGVIVTLSDKLYFSPRTTFFLASIFLLMYAGIAGASPPILRATIMGVILLGGRLFGRERDGFIALFAAAGLLLFIDPTLLWDVGFQLTFVATLSLLTLSPALQAKLENRLWVPLAIGISVSLPPLLFTIPLTAYHFNEVSLVAVFTNFIVLPFIQVFTILLFAVTPVLLVLPFYSFWISPIIQGLVALFLAIVQMCASASWAQVAFAQPPLVLVCAWYAGLGGMVLWLRDKLPAIAIKQWMVITLVLIFGLGFWSAAFPAPSAGTPGKLSVTFLDVGQGDAIFVRAPNGRTMLIDGGPGWDRKYQVLRWLRKRGIHNLGIVVLTHPHADHLAGLLPVLREIHAEEIWDSGQQYDSWSHRQFKNVAEKLGNRYQSVSAGQRFQLTRMVTLEVLHPSPPFIEGTHSDLNNNSVVILMRYFDSEFLFTGDTEKEGEERILRSGRRIESDVLKVGHHGSRTSSSPPFLKKVKPKLTVISCGTGNRFNHPHPETLDALRKMGIQIFRTDLLEDVRMETNGYEMAIHTDRNFSPSLPYIKTKLK